MQALYFLRAGLRKKLIFLKPALPYEDTIKKQKLVYKLTFAFFILIYTVERSINLTLISS